MQTLHCCLVCKLIEHIVYLIGKSYINVVVFRSVVSDCLLAVTTERGIERNRSFHTFFSH